MEPFFSAKRLGRFSEAMPAAHAWLGFRVRVCCAAADQRYSGHEIAASPPPGCVSSAWTSVRVKRPRPPLGRGLFLLSMPVRRPGHAPRGFAARSHHRDMRRGRDFRPEAGSPAKIGVGLIRPAQRDRIYDVDPAPVANPARPPRERRPVPARTPSAMLRQHFAPEGCRHDTGAARRGDKSGASDPPLARRPVSSPWRRSPGSGRRRLRVRRSPRHS